MRAVMPKKKTQPVEAPAEKPAGPKPKFMHLGRGKYVHVVRTVKWDLANSQCQQVRKGQVAGKFKGKGLSPEAALDLDAGCTDCATNLVAKQVIQAAMKPEDRKSRADDRRNEVLQRAANSKREAKEAKVMKKAVKAATPKKAPSMTKAGIRSVASAKDGDPSKTKAQLLADHGEQHGWKTSVEPDGKGWMVVAVRGEETIRAPFIDGKFDETRYGTLTVGDWTGKLRAAHACRRQMSMEGRDRPFPEPGKGRTGTRVKKADVDVPEDESPEDAARRVPFSVDDEDVVIIDHLRNKTIKWRNGKTGVLHEAWFPPKNGHVKIEANKDGKRYVVFDEVIEITSQGTTYGKTYNVYLHKILKVA